MAKLSQVAIELLAYTYRAVSMWVNVKDTETVKINLSLDHTYVKYLY